MNHPLIDALRQRDPEFIALRRDLHRHPELSWAEHATQRTLRAELIALGITDVREIAGTGLVATIPGTRPGAPVIAINPTFWLNDVLGIAPNTAPIAVPTPSAHVAPISSRVSVQLEVGQRTPIQVWPCQPAW